MKKAVVNLSAIGFALLFLLPLVWMIVVSLKPDGVSATNVRDWVDFSDLTLDNYRKIFNSSGILKWMLNSLLIGTITTVISLLISSLGAFAFSQKRFRTKVVLYVFVASGLLIPVEALLIPLYDTVLHLQLLDNMWGIILPGLTNPLGIMLLKQFMDGIPQNYVEAARLDGCRDFRLWRSVFVPLTSSAMVSVGIFYFILSWNNFIWPYIAITSEEHMVLAAALPTFLSNNTLLVNNIMAASAIAAIPAMAVFIVLQKNIVQGVAMTGIKG
jgi:multiple sugar transport system permease protein